MHWISEESLFYRQSILHNETTSFRRGYGPVIR